jgi:ABC-2 type transport system ATP-binding protein
MGSVLLSVNNLVKSYGTRRAVDGVSFRVLPGQTVGLLGPNGAGKSTIVGMLCGLLAPDSGDIFLGGERVAPGASAVKRRIGVVPQDLALYDDLSALENLKLFGALYGLRGALLAERIRTVLGQVNLLDRARDRPATYSGGMKRRLNIAAALMHDPQLLILDEPTVGVDPQSRNAIFDTLEALQAQGKALIYTSHYMEEVERLADHIVIIDHGKVLADESPASLHSRLAAQAALRVELAEPAPSSLLDGLRGQRGVISLSCNELAPGGAALEIGLAQTADALPVMGWLQQAGCRPLHFATVRTSLEDIFLTLTGRSLRD